jgi:hypothetical protein
LWTRAILDKTSLQKVPTLVRAGVGVDLPGGAGECGIVVAGVAPCLCKGTREQHGCLTFGNPGRNIVFTDGTTNVDFSLRKNTAVSETSMLEFRAEIFNFFNNTNFSGPPGRIAFTPNFGRLLQRRKSTSGTARIEVGILGDLPVCSFALPS